MEKTKLLQEHKVMLDSLVEKIRFINSYEFHKLDEKEKQKVVANKMANEGYLNSLSNTLWVDDAQSGTLDPLGLLLLTTMFGGGGTMPKFPSIPQSPTYSIPTPETKESEDKAEKAQ